MIWLKRKFINLPNPKQPKSRRKNESQNPREKGSDNENKQIFACVLMVFVCMAFACPVWARLSDNKTDSGGGGGTSG